MKSKTIFKESITIQNLFKIKKKGKFSTKSILYNCSPLIHNSLVKEYILISHNKEIL